MTKEGNTNYLGIFNDAQWDRHTSKHRNYQTESPSGQFSENCLWVYIFLTFDLFLYPLIKYDFLVKDVSNFLFFSSKASKYWAIVVFTNICCHLVITGKTGQKLNFQETNNKLSCMAFYIMSLETEKLTVLPTILLWVGFIP